MTAATMPITREQARHFTEKVRRDPVWFAREVLGIDLYDRQAEILESVRDHEQTSVNGANGVGKDFTIGAVIIPWWTVAFAPHAKTILTAPTHRQIAEIVWRETRSAYHNSRYPLGGRMMPSETKWDIDDNCFALGFSTDKPWNITGFHSPNLLVIVSEAHNVAEDVFTSLKRLHPNRLLLSFNPFSESGEAWSSHHDKRHLYNAITVSAFDSPNVKEGTDRYPGVVNRRDIEKAKEDWGEDSPLYKATVLAEFAGRADGLITLAWLMKARSQETDTGGPLAAGVDVAGPGEDETVCTVREGSKILWQRAWRLPDARGEVIASLLPYRERLLTVNIDEVGLGYFWPKDFQEAGLKMARGVNVGKSPTSDKNAERFRLLKDQLYWGLRQRFEDGEISGLSEKAVGQLASIRYSHNLKGQVVIESKDDMTERGVPSPDWAESTMLCFAATEGTVTNQQASQQTTRLGDVRKRSF